MQLPKNVKNSTWIERGPKKISSGDIPNCESSMLLSKCIAQFFGLRPYSKLSNTFPQLYLEPSSPQGFPLKPANSEPAFPSPPGTCEFFATSPKHCHSPLQNFSETFWNIPATRNHLEPCYQTSPKAWNLHKTYPRATPNPQTGWSSIEFCCWAKKRYTQYVTLQKHWLKSEKNLKQRKNKNLLEAKSSCQYTLTRLLGPAFHSASKKKPETPGKPSKDSGCFKNILAPWQQTQTTFLIGLFPFRHFAMNLTWQKWQSKKYCKFP